MAIVHAHPSPLAGQTVTVDIGGGPREYRVEDWWDRAAGLPWRQSDGNVAACQYALRAGFTGLPTDDEVLYGKVGELGHLVHMSEIVAAAVPQ